MSRSSLYVLIGVLAVAVAVKLARRPDDAPGG